MTQEQKARPTAAGAPSRNKNKKKTYTKSYKKHSASNKQAPSLRIIPLGGLDAIGKNMTVLECGQDMIMVDAGLMFPDDEHVGVDLILPDYTYVLEHADKLRGIVITHGHEDHTGALPYLLKDLDIDVPVLGTKLTLGLIKGKLSEFKLANTTNLQEVHRGGHANLGCFELDFFTVNHSIPGAMGIFIKSPAGSVLHMGDFKLDETPIDGELTDFAALARFAQEGVDLLISDSTNANQKQFTPSEAEVGVALRQIINQAKRKVIVAAFSSHIHRVQQICDAAMLAKRSVAVTGRSMLTNTRIARELGYLNVPDNLIVDAYECNDIPPHKLVILCTGSQGEPLSALARMAVGEHKTVSIERGDTVIMSATPVPGNEKSVTRVINHLSKIGADVYDKNRAMVHVSGHAGAEELKIILSIVKPKYFLPAHGEAAHLRAHAKLAQAVGVKEKNIFILDNGDSLLMKNGKVTRGEHVDSGIVYVDGSSVGDIGQDVLRDRQMLSNEGVVSLVIVANAITHSLAADPEISMRGLPGFDDEDFIAQAIEQVAKCYNDSLKAYRSDKARLKKSCRESLSKFIWSKCHRHPLIITTLMDV